MFNNFDGLMKHMEEKHPSSFCFGDSSILSSTREIISQTCQICGDTIKSQETITIRKSEYEYLLKRDKELSRLERNGVDNWSGYSEGFDDENE